MITYQTTRPRSNQTTRPLSAPRWYREWTPEDEKKVREYVIHEMGTDREIGEALAAELERTPQGVATRAREIRARRARVQAAGAR